MEGFFHLELFWPPVPVDHTGVFPFDGVVVFQACHTIYVQSELFITVVLIVLLIIACPYVFLCCTYNYRVLS